MEGSIYIDIEKQLGDQAENFFNEINKDPFEGIKNNVKNMFSHLRDEDVKEILEKYNNDVDAAFEELMDRNSQIEENKKRERKLEEERKILERNNRYIETFVRNFQMLDKKEIEEAFRNNNNDPQLTSKQLYQIIKEREQKNEEARKMKKQMELQNMVSGLSEKFSEISKEEIMRVVTENDLNVEKITFELGKMQNQKIFNDLYISYNGVFESEEIRQACEESKWDKQEVVRGFQRRIKELEMEKQRLREQEYQKQLELQRKKEQEIELQVQLQRKREEEEKREKEELKQRELELQKQKDEEAMRLKEKEMKEQVELHKKREEEFKKQLELQIQRQQELEREMQEYIQQLELQRQQEQERINKKEQEIKEIKEKKEIPQLQYNNEQLENLKQESHSKMIDVKKIIEIEEVKNEEETKKNIEKMIIECSQPEENAIKENLPASNECTIAVEIQESKIIATVDFKSMTPHSWIGFYAKEESNDKYKVYNYLCKLSDNKFSVDKPLINGSYNFRIFINSYINVQTSEEIIIQRDDFVKMVRDEKNDKVINVSWQIGSVDPYAVSAYVTVHKKEEERANYYRRWNWIKTASGTHTFKTPIHTGEYEARVYYNGKVQFRSETMKIEGI